MHYFIVFVWVRLDIPPAPPYFTIRVMVRVGPMGPVVYSAEPFLYC